MEREKASRAGPRVSVIFLATKRSRTHALRASREDGIVMNVDVVILLVSRVKKVGGERDGYVVY
jgi:hypothetical protein